MSACACVDTRQIFRFTICLLPSPSFLESHETQQSFSISPFPLIPLHHFVIILFVLNCVRSKHWKFATKYKVKINTQTRYKTTTKKENYDCNKKKTVK